MKKYFMKRVKHTQNFYIDEFVYPEIYKKFGEKSIRYMREEPIKAAQFLRSLTGLSITINNWYTGGAYKESGLRSFETSTGAKYSAHKFGCAVDLKIGDLTSFEMYDIIKNNEEVLMTCGITRVEDPEYTKGKYRSWLHIDSLYTGARNILTIKP